MLYILNHIYKIVFLVIRHQLSKHSSLISIYIILQMCISSVCSKCINFIHMYITPHKNILKLSKCTSLHRNIYMCTHVCMYTLTCMANSTFWLLYYIITIKIIKIMYYNFYDTIWRFYWYFIHVHMYTITCITNCNFWSHDFIGFYHFICLFWATLTLQVFFPKLFFWSFYSKFKH